MRNEADESTTLEVGDRDIPVEVFLPSGGDGERPGVMVIHEMWGLNDDIRRICRRLADNGYVVAAPDILQGGVRMACVARAAQALRNGDGDSVRELEAVLEMLANRPGVGPVGVVGFCLGGGFALLLACRERARVAGVFYGDPENRGREDLARACPIVGGYGMKDRTLRRKAPELVSTLDELGKEHDIELYEDAGHSFMSKNAAPLVFRVATRLTYNVGHDEEAAEDSWRRMLDFFGRHLAGAGAGQATAETP